MQTVYVDISPFPALIWDYCRVKPEFEIPRWLDGRIREFPRLVRATEIGAGAVRKGCYVTMKFFEDALHIAIATVNHVSRKQGLEPLGSLKMKRIFLD